MDILEAVKDQIKTIENRLRVTEMHTVLLANILPSSSCAFCTVKVVDYGAQHPQDLGLELSFRGAKEKTLYSRDQYDVSVNDLYNHLCGSTTCITPSKEDSQIIVKHLKNVYNQLKEINLQHTKAELVFTQQFKIED